VEAMSSDSRRRDGVIDRQQHTLTPDSSATYFDTLTPPADLQMRLHATWNTYLRRRYERYTGREICSDIKHSIL